MEIILPKKTKKVHKHNKLNNASIRLNGSEYKVYLNAIALVGGVDKNGAYVQPNQLNQTYELSAKDFSKQMNLNIDNAYKILKAAANKLIKNQIIISKSDTEETHIINIVDSAIYNKNRGTIVLQFTNSLMHYLKQTSAGNFTLYNLHEIAELVSLYSIRLYELVQQYKLTGYILRSIEQLRVLFGMDESQYKLYAGFKRRVIDQAVKEICEKTNFHIEVKEIKSKRKVVALHFSFNAMLKIQGYTPEGKVKNVYKNAPKKNQGGLL